MYDELIGRLHRYSEACVAYKLDADFASAVQEAADAIEELSAIREEQKAQIIAMAAEDKPRWIPVTERLPEFEGAVLCMRKSNVYGVRPHQEILYVDEYGFKNYDDIYLADGVVTHWMPLPEPPKEGFMKNGDAIRSMTDEELADWLGVYCNGQTAQEAGKPCTSGMGSCEECWLDWLKQEVSTDG